VIVKQLHHVVRRLWIAALATMLVACSIIEPTPSVSFQVQASPSPAAASAAATASPRSSAKLPGRLLYIDAGNLSLYRDGKTQQVTKDGKTFSPAWSPDGARIAVVQREESYSNVYLLDAQGNQLDRVTQVEPKSPERSRTLVHEVVWNDSPAWSPDGKTLVYLSQALPPTGEQDTPSLYEYPLSIHQYRLSLLGQRQPARGDVLVRSSGPDYQQPAWSPDESLLAYVRAPRTPDEQREIMLFNPKTRQTRPYPGIPANSYDPVWSPDGKWFAFTTVVDGQTDVWVIEEPSRNGMPIRLTSSGNARAAAWSPDGRILAYIQLDAQGANLYALGLETGENGAVRAGAAEQITTSGTVDANSRASWAE
jgi:TolB protein